jgi:glycosyltransferase involved in cell wall biosynthesis
MTSPSVSIVIPCYNAEPFIAQAIRSGLEQSYPHREIVVIDDGSTDGSTKVLRTFGSAIRWETGPNRGGCAARNRGLELAQGEMIQFLDADDWLYPRKLELQVAMAIASPAATPVCDGEVIESGKVVRKYTAPMTCDDSFAQLLTGPLPTPAPLHRRAALERVGGFRQDLPCSQERDLHLRLASYGWPLQRIAEPLYAVRRLPGSVSSSYERVLNQHLPIANRAREILQTRQDWTDTKARALAAFLTRDARHYVHLGHRDKAAEYFAAAREFHPSGGWDAAYGSLARIGAGLLGPVNFERLLALLKRH